MLSVNVHLDVPISFNHKKALFFSCCKSKQILRKSAFNAKYTMAVNAIYRYKNRLKIFLFEYLNNL